MADVNINLGTEGSTISDSKVSIGDVAGGHIESNRVIDLIWAEIQDIKLRLRSVEKFLEGNLGEPGLTGQVGRIKDDIRRIEQAIELLRVLDEKTEQLARVMKDYEPMWRAHMASFSQRVSVPVYVFYGVMVLLLLSIVITFMIIWSSRIG